MARNITVFMNPLELNRPEIPVNWAESEFELCDADNAPIKTQKGVGAPPDHTLFENLEDNLAYNYRARGRDADYGWSEWSAYCRIAPSGAN